MGKRIDLTGQKFGRLTVLKFSHIAKGGGSCWKCQCDCGTIKVIRSQGLRIGQSQSCGCLQRELSSIRHVTAKTREKMSKARKGHKLTREHILNRTKAQQLPKGEASFNDLYANYKRMAIKRGHGFQLSKERFRRLTQQNCQYCSAKPTSISRPYAPNGSYTYNGIDRVDSSKGYEDGNVVTCCGICNRMKMADSQEKFLEQVKRIYEHAIGGG